jgi:beta-lactamase regulating signal transducer with metallopeptidase domain
VKDILLGSSVLILALLVLRFLFRKTVSRRVQYALWGLVLLRLLIPVSLPAMKYSVLSASEQVMEPVSRLAEQPVYRERYASYPVTAYTPEELPDPRPGAVVMEGEGSYGVVDEAGENVVFYRQRLWTPAFVLRLLWYGGMAVMALLLLLQNLRFARRLRRTRVRLERAESRYPVYLCDDIPSPCLFGLFSPTIYVTSAAAKNERTLGYVVAHEETHARHLDPLWSLLRCVCLAVWWFDPLVWLAAHVSRLDCELACDEGVLARLGAEERVPYGETLLALIPLGHGGVSLISATTMTSGKRQMRDRIRRIAEGKRPLVIALAAVLVLAAVVCAVTFTGGKKEPGEGPGETPQPASPTLAPQPTAAAVTPGLAESPEPALHPGVEGRLIAAANRIFGTYGQPGPEYRISVEVDGRRDEYTVTAPYIRTVRNEESSVGWWMKTLYRWTELEDKEIKAARKWEGVQVLQIWTEKDSFRLLPAYNALCWTEEDGSAHWLRPEPVNSDIPSLYEHLMQFAQEAEQSRQFQDIAVPKSVKDYHEVARQVAEQYAAILRNRPSWYWAPPPYGAAVLDVSIFDAYYKDDIPTYGGEDFANFCFTMRLALDVDEDNRMDFDAGPGLGAPIEDGPYAGWYPWWIEAVVVKQDGQWRLRDLGSGGANVWLPYGVGWGFPDDRLTAEQLVSLYFRTWGNTRDWRLLRTLAGKPEEEVRAEMEKLSGPRHEELLQGMEKYNAEVGDVLDWAPSFDLDAYRYENIYTVTGVVVGYGADTLIATVTNAGNSPLSPGTEMIVGLAAGSHFSWLDGAGYEEAAYPLGSAVEIVYTGEVFVDDSGVCRPDKAISLRPAE